MTIFIIDTAVSENAPRFLWRNDILREFGGEAFEGLVDELTYTTYPIPLDSTFEVDDIIGCNAIGITGGTWSGQIVTVFYDDGAGWVQAGSWQPLEGVPFLGGFDFQTADKWRITLSAPVNASVIKFGMALAMQRNQYTGFSPFTKNLEILPDSQLGAHFTGKQIERIRRSAKYEYKNLTADWVRAYFKPFMRSMPHSAIFAAWRSGDYKREVVYGWIGAMPKPSNSGSKNYMSVSFELEGPLK